MDEAFKSERFLSYIQVLSNARSSNIETMRKIYEELQNRMLDKLGFAKESRQPTLSERNLRACA
jgi:hypothetical protein